MNNETFSMLIKKHTPGMYRLALGILRSGADAEYAVSEAVLKAYEKLNTLKNPERFKPWIMQITANEARKIYRKAKRETGMENADEVMPAFVDDYHELWDAVMKLDEVYREVIVLYFYGSLSVKETGKVLHIAEGTVKSRLSRGKKLLKEML